LGAQSPKVVEWNEYRFYFSNSDNAMGLHGSDAGSEKRSFNVVRSQSEWSTYWEPFFKSRSEVAATTPYPPIPEPPIDFDKHTLLVVRAGMKPTGGYTIEFSSVRDYGEMLVVSLLETVPGRSCGVTETLTYPTAAALITRTTKEIEFEVSTTTHECSP
jgi:PrcB C-terminal